MDKRIDRIEEKVDKIMDNHLPHLQQEIVAIKIQMAYWSGGIVVALAVIQLLIKFLI